MSQLSGRCGEGMYKTDCPSQYSLFIYYADEVNSAIHDNPTIMLIDFLSNWDTPHDCAKEYMKRNEPVEYWFCPSCKRVYEVQDIPHGRWLRIFTREVPEPKMPFDHSEWNRIYVMTDIETDGATEADYEITLSEFLRQHDTTQYYLSPDERVVCAVDKATDLVIYSYELEDAWTSLEE